AVTARAGLRLSNKRSGSRLAKTSAAQADAAISELTPERQTASRIARLIDHVPRRPAECKRNVRTPAPSRATSPTTPKQICATGLRPPNTNRPPVGGTGAD